MKPLSGGGDPDALAGRERRSDRALDRSKEEWQWI